MENETSQLTLRMQISAMDANNEEIKESPALPVVEETPEAIPEKFNDSGDLVILGELEDTEKQQKCWDFYVQSVIAGVPNATQSAIKAGYSESTSSKVTTWKWFKDRKKKLDRLGMLSDAEKNLKDLLNTPYIVQKQKNGEKYLELDTEIARLVLDVSKTIVKSLGKDEGYSERSEVTGKGGEPIVFMPAELLKKYDLDKK